MNIIMGFFIMLSIFTGTLGDNPALDLSGYTRIGGQASYYHPNLMYRVMSNRDLLPCEDCLGAIATADCSMLGEEVYLQRVDHDPEGPYKVGDCGIFLTSSRILEVDWSTSRRWNMSGPIFITMYRKEGARESKRFD